MAKLLPLIMLTMILIPNIINKCVVDLMASTYTGHSAQQ